MKIRYRRKNNFLILLLKVKLYKPIEPAVNPTKRKK